MNIRAVLLVQPGRGIRHAMAMKSIMRPGGRSSEVADMGSVEVIPVDETVIDEDGVVVPHRTPTPVTPTAPRGTEKGGHVDAGIETEK